MDRCPRCGGVWLDPDEVFAFSADPAHLRYEILENIEKAKETPYRSPKTGAPMASVPLFRGHMNIDVCPDTGGIWLDKGELDKLYTKPKRGFLSRLFRR